MADEDRFQHLKEKYVSVLSVVNHEKIQVHNLHVQNDKLFIRGTAPNENVKTLFWQAVRKADSAFDKDFQAEIDVKPAAKPQPAPAAAKAPSPSPLAPEALPNVVAAESKVQTYTVKPGDTLSAIAKHFYGHAGAYMQIFNANQDQLKDPDKIKVGQVLKIPPAK